MRLWILAIGLLMIGLMAPLFSGVVSAVVSSYNDVTVQIILWVMLPAFVILYSYMRLFGDRR